MVWLVNTALEFPPKTQGSGHIIHPSKPRVHGMLTLLYQIVLFRFDHTSCMVPTHPRSPLFKSELSLGPLWACATPHLGLRDRYA